MLNSTGKESRLVSIVIIFIVAMAAIGGLLWVMNLMAAPDVPDAKAETEISQPTATLTPAPTNTPDNNDDIAATVNDTIISQDTWEKTVQLDAVMNQLAGQLQPTAEETLDRLINEIIILAEFSEVPSPTDEAVETKIDALEKSWGVTEAEIVSTLSAKNLTRADLAERISRLIQVDTVLNQIATEANINTWLPEARAAAEIGLYSALLLPTENGPEVPAEQAPQVTEVSEAMSQNEVAPVAPPAAPPPDMPTAPYVDNAAPDFTLSQLSGEPLTLSKLRGKPTLVNFWASWCPPCRKELPALQSAYNKYGDTIGFVAVNVKEDAGTITAFVNNMDLDFPIALDINGEVSNTLYEARGIPTTIFVDANGVIAARHVGPLDEQMIDEYLAPLLVQEETIATTDEVNTDSSALTMITSEGITAEVSAQTQPAPTPIDDLISAPNFTTPSNQGDPVTLQDYLDKQHVVLVFYRGNT